MNRIEELKLLIEKIETKLIIYLSDKRSLEEICELSKELDRLIDKYCAHQVKWSQKQDMSGSWFSFKNISAPGSKYL